MKIYVRSTDSIGNDAADQIQRFIDGYGFSKFAVYPRTDEYLAIDIEGEDEDEVDSLLNRLHAWNLDADIYDHYIEINIADDERFNDAVTASDAMNPGWSKRYDSELQQTYYVLAIPRRTATVTEFDNDGDWGYQAQVRCKDIDSKKDKTFYGPGSLDKAMDWCEKILYK